MTMALYVFYLLPYLLNNKKNTANDHGESPPLQSLNHGWSTQTFSLTRVDLLFARSALNWFDASSKCFRFLPRFGVEEPAISVLGNAATSTHNRRQLTTDAHHSMLSIQWHNYTWF